MKFDFKSLIPHIIAVVVFLVVSMAYFYPQLQGKVVSASDYNQYTAMAKEARDYEKATGEVALWTTSMFGGMPTFQLTAPQHSNLLRYVGEVLRLGFDRPIGYFFLGMLVFYFSALFLNISPGVAIFGSIIFALSTGSMVLFDTGHFTKLLAINYSPAIVAGTILVFRNKLLLGGVLFTLALGLNILVNHPQMTYYLGIVIGLYVLAQIFLHLKEGKAIELSKKLGILLIGCILALGSSASKILTTYEYGKSTMRGAPILTENANASNSSSSVDGLDWQYAMNWSNGYEDLLASYIPLVVGGSTSEMVDKDSDLAREIPQLRNQQLPLYWGSLNSTAGPYYFGAIAFLLFVFGGISVKGKLKWWLVAGVFLTFMLSMGKNLEIFNRLMFDYFPLFNKFRTPNSVLSITGIFIALMAVVGLDNLIKSKKKEAFLRPLYISFGSLAGLALIIVLLGPSLFSFKGAYDSSFANIIDAVQDERIAMMKSSSIKTIVFLTIGFGLIYAYIKEKLGSLVLIMSIGVIALLDLWMVDTRYLDSDDFVSERRIQQEFTKRPVDEQILADPDPHFRVLDIQNFGSANASYYHKTIGGYHPAKLQRYQDLIDYHISKNNQKVFNMLNTKYIIYAGKDGQVEAQRNTEALGNAWFVKQVIIVNSADEEIKALTDFNPGVEAIVHKEFSGIVNKKVFSGEGNIILTNYTPNKVTYSSSSQEEQLAVFSEIWYQPGWKAYIDGNEVDHIRVNYVLRGLTIPAGNHEVEFEFKPNSYFMGEKISLISSLLIFLGLGFLLYKHTRKLLASSKE